MRIQITQYLCGNWVTLGHAVIKENQKPEEMLDTITTTIHDYETMSFNEKEGTSAFFFTPKQGPIRLGIVE